MYIPRPTKLLFTIDDGWNRNLGSNGDSVSHWARLCVERTLSCGTASMGVRRYCCASPDCPHSSLPELQVKGLQRLWLQSHGAAGAAAEPHPPRLRLAAYNLHHAASVVAVFNNNWPLLNALFRAATRAMLRWALHTYGRQFSQYPHIHLSVTRGRLDVKHGVWRDLFFKKQPVKEI